MAPFRVVLISVVALALAGPALAARPDKDSGVRATARRLVDRVTSIGRIGKPQGAPARPQVTHRLVADVRNNPVLVQTIRTLRGAHERVAAANIRAKGFSTPADHYLAIDEIHAVHVDGQLTGYKIKFATREVSDVVEVSSTGAISRPLIARPSDPGAYYDRSNALFGAGRSGVSERALQDLADAEGNPQHPLNRRGLARP